MMNCNEHSGLQKNESIIVLHMPRPNYAKAGYFDDV